MSAFIQFEGVEGESLDDKHKKWCDTNSVSQGWTNPTPAGAYGVNRQRGDTQQVPFHVTRDLDKASPKLAEAICMGKTFGKVLIEVTRSFTDGSRSTYLKYELKDVQITDYIVNISSDGTPTESLTLNFDELKQTYTVADKAGKSAGNVEYSWKVGAGKK